MQLEAVRRRLLRCRFCSYTALYHSLLARHERIHTGDRPYQCPSCSKRFVQKTHMENHLRMHSGERPFQCDLCARAFATASALAGHVLGHKAVVAAAMLPAAGGLGCAHCSAVFASPEERAEHECFADVAALDVVKPPSSPSY